MDGELLAEYRQGYAPFVPSKEYGYRNGQLLVTASNGDEQRVSNFVDQLFLRAAVLQTATNNAPLHVNTLANAGAQGETQLRTAAQTVVRQIYQASTLPAADLVAALYLGVLQRYGDAGGLSYWTSVAQSDRNGVIEAFIAPGEFDQRVQVLFGRELSDVERTDNFTKYLYTTILNRGASATEKGDRRAAVDGASAQGQASVVTNAKDFGRSLFNGVEYAGRNRTNSEYVLDLYLAFFRYAPAAEWWNYWTGVANSQGRAGVLEVFVNAEAFEVQAGALYREVLWLVADHLGTPRMIAERSGTPAGIKHHDYLPFGEELFNGIAGRDAAHGYGAVDSARNQFTGYERDDETGLDYAQARYYSSAMGRFIGIDKGPFIPADPQTWNRYTFVLNNPLKFIDPDGYKVRLSGKERDALIEYWEKKTGLDLEADKKGNITIVKNSVRNEQGTSKELAEILQGVINDKKTVSFEVVSGVESILFDDGGNAQKEKRLARLDISDFQQVDSQSPELGAALTGHILAESLEIARGRDFLQVDELDNNGKIRKTIRGAHQLGQEAESRVLSGYTGRSEGIRQESQPDFRYAKYTFVYTSVQYDIILTTLPERADAIVVTRSPVSPK